MAGSVADVGFRRCVGIDLSIGMLNGRGGGSEGVRFKALCLCQADARALPFRTASFDSVLNCFMIDLLPEAEIPIVMREFGRVLRAEASSRAGDDGGAETGISEIVDGSLPSRPGSGGRLPAD